MKDWDIYCSLSFCGLVVGTLAAVRKAALVHESLPRNACTNAGLDAIEGLILKVAIPQGVMAA